VLHCPRPGQPAPTQPVPKLVWADLLVKAVEAFAFGAYRAYFWTFSPAFAGQKIKQRDRDQFSEAHY